MENGKKSPNLNGPRRAISAEYTKPAQLYRARALSSVAPSRFTYRWAAIAARLCNCHVGPDARNRPPHAA